MYQPKKIASQGRGEIKIILEFVESDSKNTPMLSLIHELTAFETLRCPIDITTSHSFSLNSFLTPSPCVVLRGREEEPLVSVHSTHSNSFQLWLKKERVVFRQPQNVFRSFWFPYSFFFFVVGRMGVRGGKIPMLSPSSV